MNNIEKMQNKLDKRFSEEKIQVLEANGAKGKLVYKCLSCGKHYTFAHGENAYSKRKKYACHECGSKNQKKESFVNKLNQLFPQDELEVIDFSTREDSGKIKCNKCGEEYYFSSMKNALKKTRDKFCHKCFPYKENQRQNVISDFIEWLNENSKKWKLVGTLDVKNTKDKVSCQCLSCGKIIQRTMYDFMQNRKCACENHATPITQEQFEDRMSDEFELLSKYNGVYSKVKIRHKTCGFIRDVTARQIWITGGSCPKCSKKRSIGEDKISQYLQEHNIPFIQEYNIKIKGHNLYLDFYLPQQDLYIEFNGIQHYQPVKHFGGESRFQIQQKYDNLKKDFLQEKLITISYQEIDNISILLDELLSSTTIM